MTDKPVLIIGGTRATGLHAARALRGRGVPVRVLARDPKAAAERLGPGFEIVRGDLTKPPTIAPCVAGVSHIVFTAGVRSGRFARQSVVRATEFRGVTHTLEAARATGFAGRFVYMTAIGVRSRSLFAAALNIWKGNTLRWRRRAEDAIRGSGLDYSIVRAAFLLNRPANARAITVRQNELPLTLFEMIGRADVAEALAEAVFHPSASRATFELTWDRGPRTSTWSELLTGLKPDPEPPLISAISADTNENPGFVPEQAIDYEAVFARGGTNFGDEDFALFKCPRCDAVYLLDYEVDTVYLDATDLSKRAPVSSESFVCTRCNKLVPRGAWAGPRPAAIFRVTWDELRTSPWAWAVTKRD